MIRILTDSAADLTARELAEYHIQAVPLRIHFGEKTYLDGETLDIAEFYDLLQSSADFPQTSQPSPADFAPYFEAAQAAGDEVVAVLLSSALSGTFQGARIARDIVGYEGVHLIDSLSVTVGQRLLLTEAVKMRDAGCSAAEIVEKLEHLKGRICIWASLDTLEYLCKGGRLSRTAAGIGTLTNMKPIITISPEGTVAVLKKCIGRKRAIDQLLQLTEAKQPDEHYPLLCVYSHDRANADALLARMAEKGCPLQVADCVNIGPTIGVHVGTGAYGLAYIAAE